MSATDTEQGIPEKASKEENVTKSGGTGAPVFDPPPDGGLKAWLVAAGGACIFFCALGFSNSFGVFQEYYIHHQLKGQSDEKVAWIGSLQACLQFMAGIIGGPLFDRYGSIVIRLAAVCLVFGVMMTSLCKEYWEFMLAQGVLMGIAMGFVQFPAMAALTQYFMKKRGAAMGLTISGSSIGGVVFPLALSKMLNSTDLGYGWSVRIMGFVIIPVLSFAAAVVTPRLPPRKSSFFVPSAFLDPKFDILTVSVLLILIGMFSPLFYIPSYAVTTGMKATLASYLLAILNAASTFGRIIPGFLADKFGKLNMFAIGSLTTGVWSYSLATGFATGTIISGASAAFTLCIKNPQEGGAVLGMGMGVGSLAALIGPPVNGVLANKYGFGPVGWFSGALCVVGGFLVLSAKITTPKGLFGRV
ncbi:hypothetical protein N7468_008830 [Penicillium chermesinum]|uniref:Major facilitator superfamily (MFS) profile domain-containing protein n=1 Tax=Penicillium chermesinum TaxID=63820 RepID=A0A9W9NGU9_9EURO|nr:uncharacterized protein N7468_008830 [Penicillium chermesinum]KAJ5219626.1 hypothetical protein N7468_008830 [Penicillium chermesinum]